MKKNRNKFTFSWVLYFIGFIMYVFFMHKVNVISPIAHKYTFLLVISVILFMIGVFMRD